MEESHLLRDVYPNISMDDRGLYLFPEGRRVQLKKFIPKSDVDDLRIYTNKEVLLLYNSAQNWARGEK